MSPPKKVDLICVICSDNGIGRNFGVITCESCKVFFRRNAIKTKQLIRKTDKIVTKKSLNESTISSTTDSTTSDSNDHIIETNGYKLFNNNNNNFDDLIIDDTFDDDYQECDKDIKIMWNMAVKSYTYNPVFKQLTDLSQFNEFECYKLTELMTATKVLNYMHFKINDVLVIADMCTLMRFCVQKIELNTKDLIMFAKKLSAFDSLCLDDQISLMKYGCLEIIILRDTHVFDYNNECSYGVVGNKKAICWRLNVTKTEKRNLYENYRNFYYKIIPHLVCDLYILDLLSAIILFNPNRPNLKHRDVIKVTQQMYIYLLQRYVLLKFKSGCLSETNVSKLMNAMIDLQMISEIKIRNGAEIYQQLFGPFLQEILFNVNAK
ncbi:nuclear hormone receptor HR96-like [Oppia nitens]|uniref:nuclear hormone receptor HR96-like n=1 Tax=Oppia nitens TaxID=1686743 RepID=UPI0023D99DD1|nr:nuclear hormone receptor HR96-like [Oppia nitens]